MKKRLPKPETTPKNPPQFYPNCGGLRWYNEG